MVTMAAKELLRNTIRNTDYHNRLLEEEEMWRHWETEKGLTMMVTDDYLRRRMRMDEYSKPGQSTAPGSSTKGRRVGGDSARGGRGSQHKCDVRELQKQKQAARVSQKGQSNFWMRKLMETEEKDPDRWGHSGYKELYPEEFKSSNSRKDRSSSSPSEGLRSRQTKFSSRTKNQQSKSTNQNRWDHSGFRELYPDEFKSRHRHELGSRHSRSPAERRHNRTTSVERGSGSAKSSSSTYSRRSKAKTKKKRKHHSRKKSKKHKKHKKKSVPVITISSDSSQDNRRSSRSSTPTSDSTSAYHSRQSSRSAEARGSQNSRTNHRRSNNSPRHSTMSGNNRNQINRGSERSRTNTTATTITGARRRTDSESSATSVSMHSSSSRQSTSQSPSAITSRSTSRSSSAAWSRSSQSPPPPVPLSRTSSSSSSPGPSSYSLGSEVSYVTSKSGSGTWASDASESMLETRREYLKRKLEEVAASSASSPASSLAAELSPQRPSKVESGSDAGSSRHSVAGRNGNLVDAMAEPERKRVRSTAALITKTLPATIPRKLKSQVVRDGATTVSQRCALASARR